MEKTTNDGQITDTSSYLNEGTVIPETNYEIPPTEQEVAGDPTFSIPDTSMDSHDPELAAHSKAAKARDDKKGGFIKKNLPLVVVGAIAGGLLLLALVGKMVNGSAPQAPVQTATPAPAPQAAAPEPAPALVIGSASRNEDVVDVKVYRDLQERLRQAEEKAGALESTVAQLEGELRSAEARLAAERASRAAAKPAETPSSRLNDLFDKKIPPLATAEGYTLRAARNGLAWIDTPDGGRVNVRQGDEVHGIGVVKVIDEIGQRVQVGDVIVR